MLLTQINRISKALKRSSKISGSFGESRTGLEWGAMSGFHTEDGYNGPSLFGQDGAIVGGVRNKLGYVASEEAKQQAASLAALNNAAPFLRKQLMERVHIRRVPRFEFEADHTIEEGARMLDLMIRAGRVGDRFREGADGMTLDSLVAAEHGVDLGPLASRLPAMLATESGHVELERTREAR